MRQVRARAKISWASSERRVKPCASTAVSGTSVSEEASMAGAARAKGRRARMVENFILVVGVVGGLAGLWAVGDEDGGRMSSGQAQ